MGESIWNGFQFVFTDLLQSGVLITGLQIFWTKLISTFINTIHDDIQHLADILTLWSILLFNSNSVPLRVPTVIRMYDAKLYAGMGGK